MAFIFLHETIKTYKDRGSAECSSLEVVLCYLSVHKIVFIKLSHALRMYHLFLLDRSASHISRWLTGIAISGRKDWVSGTDNRNYNGWHSGSSSRR
jgi:serine acetyltransferase